MALTPSIMMPLGTVAPDFDLTCTVTGKQVMRDKIVGNKGLLVMFICNHCPFVIHIEKELAKFGNDYLDSGIGIVGINSNDVENYPADAPDKMKETAKRLGYTFPYLFDETQEVAKAYDATCTPDIFLFDKDLKCVYRGRFDASRPGNDIPVTGKDLRNAMDRLVKGDDGVPEGEQIASAGCSIKWKG